MLSARLWIGPRKPQIPLFLVGILASALTLPGDSWAVDIIKFEVDFFEDDVEEPVNHATIWTSGRKIRVDQMKPGGGQHGSSLVYRGDLDLVVSVSDRTQSYVRIERRLLTQIDDRLRAGRRAVQHHLKSLPGDQRKGVESLLGVAREDPNATVNPIEVLPSKSLTDRSGEVAGFSCTRKVMRRGVVVIGKACVAPWERVGMTRDDMEVFRSLANYQRDALGAQGVTPLELVPDQPLDIIVQLGGIPLSFERTIGEQSRSAVRVTSVDWISEEGTLFDPPANYTLATGYAAMLSHLTPTSDSPASLADRIAANGSPAAPVPSPTPAAATPPASPAPPAAPAFSASPSASRPEASSRPRAIVLRSTPNQRRTVGATPDRKAPVRLFPNH